jgi:hypothetical protein
LHRGNAQIRQNPVGAADALQDEIEIPEVLFGELDSIRETLETLAGEIERVGIAVNAEQTNSRSSLEKRLGMSAGAERRVDEETPTLGLEQLGDLFDQDRYVPASFNRPDSFVFPRSLSTVDCRLLTSPDRRLLTVDFLHDSSLESSS